MQCGREPPSEKVAGVAQELRTVQFANWEELSDSAQFAPAQVHNSCNDRRSLNQNPNPKESGPALIAKGIHNLDGDQFSSQPRQDLLKESGPDQVLRSHRRSSSEFDPQVEVRRSVRRLTVPYGQQAASGHAQKSRFTGMRSKGMPRRGTPWALGARRRATSGN